MMIINVMHVNKKKLCKHSYDRNDNFDDIDGLKGDDRGVKLHLSK